MAEHRLPKPRVTGSSPAYRSKQRPKLLEGIIITIIMGNTEVVKVDFANLPDLAQATPEPVEMSGEYWTPEEVGETRRLFFFGLNLENVVDMESGETRELPVVQFVEPDGKGGVRSVRNGSRRLVGIFESFASSIKQGDAFEIAYLGKKKNKNNAYKSDNWSVRRLTIQ